MKDLFNFDNETPDIGTPGNVNPMINALIHPSMVRPKSGGGGILGVLGDFLLDSTGFGDIIKERKLKQAMAGYSDDPEAAIQNAMNIDPKFGMTLMNVASDNKRADSVASANEAYKGVQSDAREQAIALKNRGIATSYVSSILNNKSLSPEDKAAAYSAALPRLRALPSNAFFDPSKDLPDTYDEGYLSNYAGSGMTVQQQESQGLGERKQDHKEAYDTTRLGQYDRGLDQGDRRLGQGDRSLDIREEGVGIARDRANAYIQNGNRNAGKAKPVMRYPGEDGYYHVQFDDGSEVTSNVKVRPTGKTSPLASLMGKNTPPPPPPRKAGDRIRGPGGVILTSKDGKTWSK